MFENCFQDYIYNLLYLSILFMGKCSYPSCPCMCFF